MASETNLTPNARGVMKHFIACLEQWTDCPKVRCSCEGCPTLIPFWWYSGMCGDCGREDCTHDAEEILALLKPLAPEPAPATRFRCVRCGMDIIGGARPPKVNYCGDCLELVIPPRRP